MAAMAHLLVGRLLNRPSWTTTETGALLNWSDATSTEFFWVTSIFCKSNDIRSQKRWMKNPRAKIDGSSSGTKITVKEM